MHLEWREPPRQDKAGRTRFVTDPQFGAGMGLPQLGENLLQGVQIVGDGAVGAAFASPPSARARRFLRVDIESDEQ
jgi:hypothetical protein